MKTTQRKYNTCPKCKFFNEAEKSFCNWMNYKVPLSERDYTRPCVVFEWREEQKCGRKGKRNT